MLVKPAADIPFSEITPKNLYLRRREFLQAAAFPATTVLAAVFGVDHRVDAAQRGDKLAVTRKMVTTTDQLTPLHDVTTFNNFYEFGSQKVDPAQNSGGFKSRPWSVTVEGACNKPGIYTLEDILKPHSLEERVYRMRCVEGWSMVIPWVGFPLGDLLKRFDPTSRAKFVEFTTVLRPREMPGQRGFLQILPWPYKEGLRIDEAMHPLTILAVGLYGETLPNQNGAPLRLVVPWKYGFKGIKSIMKIRFAEAQPATNSAFSSPGMVRVLFECESRPHQFNIWRSTE